MSLESQASADPITSQPDTITQIVNWISDHQEWVVEGVSRLFFAVLILLVGLYIARYMTKLLVRSLTKKGVDSTIVDFVSSMIRYALVSLVIIVALSQIGIEMASFIAVLSAAALAVGLALKGSLSDFAAGVLLVSLRPFKVGNFIEAAGVAGSVESIQVFNSILKTGDNKQIIVPNSKILKGNIVNFSRKSERRIDLVIRVSYQSDLKQAKEVLEKTVLANEKVLKQPGLQIAVAELSSSSVDIVVRPWVKSSDYWPVRFALTESIKNELELAKIKIPYRQLNIHCK